MDEKNEKEKRREINEKFMEIHLRIKQQKIAIITMPISLNAVAV